MFFKIGVLKNLAIFTRKHLCCSLFLIVAGLTACTFIEKETLTQVFFCEHCEIIQNNFFIEHLLLIILFWNFYVITELVEHLWVQNWYFLYFLCHCFVFFYDSSVRIGTPWLYCICIYTKIFSKYNFRMHYNLSIRNNI